MIGRTVRGNDGYGAVVYRDVKFIYSLVYTR